MSIKTIGDKSFEAILAEIQRSAASAEGMTVREICKATGKSDHIVKCLLRAAIEQGKAKCTGRKLVAAIDGSMRPSPAYRVVAK